MTPILLSQLGKIVTGKTPKTSREDFFGGSTPFVTPSDMDQQRTISKTARTLSKDGVTSVKNSVIPAGAIMVSCIGSDMGKTYISGARSVTNQQINSLIVTDERASPLFIYYNLFGRRVEIREKAAGAAQPILNKTEFGKIVIDLPEIEEQREISAILGALDDKIELNRKTAATLEEMARALYRSWFVDFDPVHARSQGLPPAHMPPTTAALFPNSFSEDGLPEGWSCEIFPHLVELISGGTPKTSNEEYWGGDLPWYSVVDAPASGAIFVIKTEKTVTDAGFNSCSAKKVPKGATIISARGTVGKLAMAGQDMIFNQSCYGLRGRDNVGDAFTYFSAVRAVEELQSMAHGSVFSTITRNTFEGILLTKPPAEILQSFEVVVGGYLERIFLLTQENQTLATLRDTLLPRLMSGELRVGDARDQIKEAM